MRRRREERAEAVQRRLEAPLLVAALAVIPVLVLEEADTSPAWTAVAVGLNWAIWSAFAVEAAIMLAITPDRWRWIRRHPIDVAIVLLTPPFLPAALQSMRVFRLLRLLRLLKAIELIRRLFSVGGLRWATLISLATILVGGVAFAAVESPEQRLDSWDGVWWALTTVTTVGYGDYAPETGAGRTIALAVMAVGIGFVALITAAAAERFVALGREEDVEREDSVDQMVISRLDEIAARLDRLERAVEEARREDRP